MRIDRPAYRLTEMRLEITKHTGNAALNFLKHLHDRRAIWERYSEGHLRLHLHFAAGIDSLLPWKGEGRFPAFCLSCHPDPLDVMGLFMDADETVVLVEVGEVSEQCHTIPSRVRLALSDQCDVWFADSFEMGLAPSLEDIWIVFKRKLNLIADTARILVREGARDVIQGIAQAVGKFPDPNLGFGRQLIDEILHEFSTECRIRIIGQDIRIVTSGKGISNPRQMFVCPIDQGLDFIERLRHVHGSKRNPDSATV
jgi:hypothetical protein